MVSWILIAINVINNTSLGVEVFLQEYSDASAVLLEFRFDSHEQDITRQVIDIPILEDANETQYQSHIP